MSAQFACTVNSVGPTSGDWEANFLLDPRDDPSTHGPVIVLRLTALDDSFKEFSFLVDAAVSNPALAVAIAAINTGAQVMADVTWPPPSYQDPYGGTLPGNPYCYSLWLIGAQAGP